MNKLRILIFFSLSCCVMAKTYSDGKFETETYFRQLMKKDDFFLEFLDLCIEKEEFKLYELKNALAMLEEDIMPQPDPVVFKDDINRSFKLMKRMAHDWRVVTNYASANVTEDLTKSMKNRLKNEYSSVPEPDVAMSVESLNRLRHFTEVSHADLANGNLGRVQLNSTLNPNDLYIISKLTIEAGDIVDGTKWLVEAYKRIGNREDIFKTLYKILHEFAWIYFKTGHYDDVVADMETVLDFELDDERPLRFLDELDAVKAKGVPENSTEDLSAYEKAYPDLPSVKSIFGISISLDPSPPIEIDKNPPEFDDDDSEEDGVDVFTRRLSQKPRDPETVFD